MGRAFEFRKARKMKRWSKMAKTFTRIGKDIVIAVKDGGASPETNSRLRQVMQNAKAANMPKDNVLRAIKKASSKDTANYEEISLEGYAVNGIAPGKASNAGGVATSGLEMSQNSLRMNWTREEVDTKLKTIMNDIHSQCVEHGKEGNFVNYVKGANIAGFLKVADAMLDQGIV